MHVLAVGCEEFLLLREVRTVGCNDAVRVQHQYVFLLQAQRHIQFCARNGSCACAVHHQLHLCDVFSSHFKRIFKTCGRYDGCAVLVVVHHRNVQRALQAFFYSETFGSLDVLKVNAAKRRSYLFDRFAELVGVGFVYLYIEHIDAAVNLK